MTLHRCEHSPHAGTQFNTGLRLWCLDCGYESDPSTWRRLRIPRGKFAEAKRKALATRATRKPV